MIFLYLFAFSFRRRLIVPRSTSAVREQMQILQKFCKILFDPPSPGLRQTGWSSSEKISHDLVEFFFDAVARRNMLSSR